MGQRKNLSDVPVTIANCSARGNFDGLIWSRLRINDVVPPDAAVLCCGRGRG